MSKNETWSLSGLDDVKRYFSVFFFAQQPLSHSTIDSDSEQEPEKRRQELAVWGADVVPTKYGKEMPLDQDPERSAARRQKVIFRARL